MFNKIKQNKKSYFIGFFIPFINMVAYLIEFTCTYPFDKGWDESYMTYSEMIGGIFLLEIIPLAFIITLIIPPKWIIDKRKIYKILLLMTLFGWFLAILSYYITGVILNLMAK